MKKNTVLVGLILLTITSCKVAPEPINYGSDACHFCSMTLVDQQHAAQIVTEKGKAFKFDASECMMNYLKEADKSEIALFLVNDYTNPGELMDATKATYLISKDIPSPMGEFLTAFSSLEEAQKAESNHEGEIYSWEELTDRFKD